MSTKKKSFTGEQFDVLVPALSQELAFELERELAAVALPELGGEAGPSGLWDLPMVDSKTVCKLSPIVKKYLERRLDPSWVRKGGYETVEEAIKDVIAKAREDCVRDPVITIPERQGQPSVVSFRRT